VTLTVHFMLSSIFKPVCLTYADKESGKRCSKETLVSADVSFAWIFTEVGLRIVCSQNWQFSVLVIAISSEPSKIKQKVLPYV